MATIILRTVAAGGLRPEFEHVRGRERRAAQDEKDAASPRSRQLNERAVNHYDFSWKNASEATLALVLSLWRSARGPVLPMNFTPAGHTDADVEEVKFVKGSLRITRADPLSHRVEFSVKGAH